MAPVSSDREPDRDGDIGRFAGYLGRRWETHTPDQELGLLVQRRHSGASHDPRAQDLACSIEREGNDDLPLPTPDPGGLGNALVAVDLAHHLALPARLRARD